MRLSHKAALVGLVGVPVLAVLAIRVICAVVVSWHVDPELARLNEDATRFWPELEADLKALKADPFFTTPRAGGDAGALLHSALPQASAVPRIQRSATGHTLSLPSELVIRVVGDVFKAQQAVTDDDLTALDFRWMAELEQYGYWELTTAPRFAHDGPIDALQMPVPDFTLLMSWAKLRLIDGHRKGTLVAARREVRHLAWLTLTTENLVGAMVGLALLGIEERARQIFAPEQPPAVSGREAARRAVWALFMLHHEGLSTDAVERAVATARGSVLLCVTLSESAISEPYARGLLYDHYEQAYAARDRLVSDPPPLCRMTLGRRARIIAAVDVLDEGAARMYDAITPDGVVANLADAIFLRPVRHLAGLLILTTDVPDGYQRYRDLEDARARE